MDLNGDGRIGGGYPANYNQYGRHYWSGTNCIINIIFFSL
jgi:hypothetical protein